MLSFTTQKDFAEKIPKLFKYIITAEAITTFAGEVDIRLELPWWEVFTLGLLRWKYKRQLEFMLATYATIGVKYNIIFGIL